VAAHDDALHDHNLHAQLLKIGVSPQTIREATRVAAPRAGGPIQTFRYFAKPHGAIMNAHADALRAAAIAPPTLPLPLTPQRGRGINGDTNDTIRSTANWRSGGLAPPRG
jgi:hypothetical protein